MDRAKFIGRGLAIRAFQGFALTVGPGLIDGFKWLDEHPPLAVLRRFIP
jgi:hypothetical protein